MKIHIRHNNSMMTAMHNMMQEMDHASMHGDPEIQALQKWLNDQRGHHAPDGSIKS